MKISSLFISPTGFNPKNEIPTYLSTGGFFSMTSSSFLIGMDYTINRNIFWVKNLKQKIYSKPIFTISWFWIPQTKHLILIPWEQNI